MSAFDIAWALLKADEKPDIFGHNFGGGNDTKPDLFSFTGGAMGNDSGSNPESKPSVQAKPSVQSKPDIFGTTDNQQVESPSHAEGNGHDLAITGDQAWDDLDTFDDKMQEWIDIHGMPSKIVTGDDKGTHQMAQLFAQNNNIECQVHSKKDLKEEHGYGARDVMNQNIVDGASHMLAFPHHEETSTSDAIGRAYHKDIPVHSHFTFSHPGTPLRDHEERKTEREETNAEKPHWFKDWVGDVGAKTHPEEHEGGAKRGLDHAIRRRVSTRGPNSGYIAQGFDETGQHMRMNTGKDGRGGSVEGLVGTPLNASTTRHLPRDTRTADDKAHDRLVEMAQDAAESGHFGVNVEPRNTPGMSRMQHIAERKRAKQERNRQAATGNLPVDFKGGPTDATRAAEEAMWSDIGRLEDNKPNERKVPMHRGKRGDEPEEVDAEQQELERRGRHNEQELRDAKRLGRAPELLSTESDEEGNLEALADPHHINDLRFKVGKMDLSPMIEAFNFIKGF